MSKTLAKATNKELLHIAYTANIYREDGDYVAECAELGTVSQGRTPEQALNMLREATRLYLASATNVAIIPIEERPDFIAGVRELEAAYARQLDEPIVPADIQFVASVQFILEPIYA